MPYTLLQVDAPAELDLVRVMKGLMTAAVAALAGVLVYALLAWILRRAVARRPWGLHTILFRRLSKPLRYAIPVVFVLFATVQIETGWAYPLPRLHRLSELGTIAMLTWLIAALAGAIVEYVKLRYDVAVSDNREARRIHTEVTVLGRCIQTVIIIIGTAVALMTIDGVRQIGTSLLASAGIAGLVVGLAARPVLENLIAGLQLGFTQPVRLDDVVVIDGEWGRIEEISMTYVVVKIWDERRLIVPFSRLLSAPFQNWTRSSSDLLAYVFIWVDYAAPLDEIRAEAEKIVRAAPHWDGRVCVVQVTDATDRAIQIRVLGSAGSGPAAWDFRVHVREKLIDYLRREHPDVLPQARFHMLESEPPQPVQQQPVPPLSKKTPAARPGRGNRRK